MGQEAFAAHKQAVEAAKLKHTHKYSARAHANGMQLLEASMAELGWGSGSISISGSINLSGSGSSSGAGIFVGGVPGGVPNQAWQQPRGSYQGGRSTRSTGSSNTGSKSQSPAKVDALMTMKQLVALLVTADVEPPRPLTRCGEVLWVVLMGS